MKKVILITLGVLAVVGALIGGAFLVDGQLQFKLSSKHQIYDLEGELAPEFEAKVVGENRVLTLQDLRGKPSLLVFFATYCPYCKQQVPETIEVMEKFGDDANVVFVNARQDERLQVLHCEQLTQIYLKKNDWTHLPAVVAPREMQDAFKLSAIPTIVVLDREGRVSYAGLANHSSEELEELVSEVL